MQEGVDGIKGGTTTGLQLGIIETVNTTTSFSIGKIIADKFTVRIYI